MSAALLLFLTCKDTYLDKGGRWGRMEEETVCDKVGDGNIKY